MSRSEGLTHLHDFPRKAQVVNEIVSMHSLARSCRLVFAQMWALLLVAISLSGCAVDNDTPSEAVIGESEQAVTRSAEFEWGSTTSMTADLGPADSETCFLTSLRGNMITWMTDMGYPDSPARAGAAIVNGRWVFHEWSNGGAMAVTVRCVPVVTNRTAVATWTSGSAATFLAPGAPNRHCFLTEVAKTNYWGWTTDADSVRVWKDPSNNWYIGGPQSTGVRGSAICVDFPGDYGSWLWVAGTGSGTHDLAYNPGGVDCFLTGLGGHFNAQDYSDGVTIGYDAGTRTYNETVVNGKSGWATCVQ